MLRGVLLLVLAAPLGCGGPAVNSNNADAGTTANRDMAESLIALAGQPGGLGHADGVGEAARFASPSGITGDGAGHLFVADTGNNVIRQIDLATGAVITLAGDGGEGYADGPFAMARFNQPMGIVSDGAGNLYVADSRNQTIRWVALGAGRVRTLPTSAALFDPEGLAYDGAGNLFVSDSRNHTIVQIAIATGVVTTLAGSPGMMGSDDGTGAAARFFQPRGIAYDGGNLFVADQCNDTIRQIVVATGVVTTLAGTASMAGLDDGTGAAARFNMPRDIWSDGAGTLFVADSENMEIRKIVIATRAVSTLAGMGNPLGGSADGIGTAAGFADPEGITGDAFGNLFIADTANSTIRKIVSATAAVSTPAGAVIVRGSADGVGAAARFDGPSGVTYDGAGHLFLADTNNHTIRKVALASGAVTTVAGAAGLSGSADGPAASARFDKPSFVVSDGAGKVYVSDSGNDTIRAVDVAAGTVTTLAGQAGSSGSADGVGAAARFRRPQGIALDGAGNLYVADSDNETIRQIVIATGTVTTLAGAPGIWGSLDDTGIYARFARPTSLAWDGAGKLFVGDLGDPASRSIRQITIPGAVVTTLASGQPADAPVAMASDGAGNLFAAFDSAVSKLVLPSAMGLPVVGRFEDSRDVELGPLPGRLFAPSGIAIIPGGIAITDASANVVLIATNP